MLFFDQPNLASFDPCFSNPATEIAQDFQWLEFFAGTAACTHAMREAGFRSARFDKLYCKDPSKHGRKSNWMDICTPSGFALLDCKKFAKITK